MDVWAEDSDDEVEHQSSAGLNVGDLAVCSTPEGEQRVSLMGVPIPRLLQFLVRVQAVLSRGPPAVYRVLSLGGPFSASDEDAHNPAEPDLRLRNIPRGLKGAMALLCATEVEVRESQVTRVHLDEEVCNARVLHATGFTKSVAAFFDSVPEAKEIAHRATVAENYNAAQRADRAGAGGSPDAPHLGTSGLNLQGEESGGNDEGGGGASASHLTGGASKRSRGDPALDVGDEVKMLTPTDAYNQSLDAACDDVVRNKVGASGHLALATRLLTGLPAGQNLRMCTIEQRCVWVSPPPHSGE
jgi:hypothetical protein